MPVATWNPDDKSLSIALSGGNLIASPLVKSGEYAARGTTSKGSSGGKWYFEVLLGESTAGKSIMIGLMNAAASLANGVGKATVGTAYDLRGYKYLSNSYTSGPPSSTTGDVIGVAWDSAEGRIWWSKNNIWMQSGDPSNNTSPMYTSATLINVLYPAVSFYGPQIVVNSTSLSARFKEADFSYAPPTGFLPWGPANVSISGNLTKSNAEAGDYVAIIDSDTKSLEKLVVPDVIGDWSASVPAGDYYIIYFGNGYPSQISGPHTISTGGVSPAIPNIVLGSSSGTMKTVGYAF